MMQSRPSGSHGELQIRKEVSEHKNFMNEVIKKVARKYVPFVHHSLRLICLNIGLLPGKSEISRDMPLLFEEQLQVHMYKSAP